MPSLPLGSTVNAGFGIRVRSDGVQARNVRAVATAEAGTRGGEAGALGALRSAFVGADDEPSAILAAALDDEGAMFTHTIELDQLRTRPTDGSTTRGPEDLPQLRITIPAPARGNQAQAILEVDGSGLVRWHFASPATGTGTDSTERGSSEQVYVIPVQALPAASTQAETRSGGIWRKALHIIRFDWVAGKVGEALIGAWERKNRPHQLGEIRRSTLSAGSAAVHPIGPEWFRNRTAGRYLLLVHGTFSSTDGGFSALLNRSGFFDQMADRYDAVLCFDHPTISVSPERNATELLRYLPSDRSTELDIVCHSRGGLVSRQLFGAENATGAGVPVPTVNRLIYVASPNFGTPLASPNRIDMLLSVFTNMAGLIPEVTVAGIIKGVLQVVKQLATGLVSELDGIAAMDPASASLAALNRNVAAQGAFAIASDFTPAADALAARAINVAADLYFRTGNDLVVPTDGVASAGQFVIPEARRFRAPATVSHSGYFADQSVRDELIRVLSS